MNDLSWRLPLIATLWLAQAGCGQPPPPPQAATLASPLGVTADATSSPLPHRSPAPAGASVAILSPRNGDIVSSPVKVVFDLQGMTLAAAGDPAPNSGHHHLLVDVPVPNLGQTIPKDAQHLHFGQAQTEAEIVLTPGHHTLQLLLGDSSHVPHDPALLSPPITITVQ